MQRPQTELISRQSAEGPDKEIKMDAPKSFTMERLGDTKQVVVAQSTSQMCRTGCCQVRAREGRRSRFSPGGGPRAGGGAAAGESAGSGWQS